MINNLIFKKIWQDEHLMELKITGTSEFVSAWQTCYIDMLTLQRVARQIQGYIACFDKDCYIVIGNKQGNSSPAFSMNIRKTDNRGHVNIEVDIEIEDISDRSHRCLFFISSELGLLERFGKGILSLMISDIDTEVALYE